jgi:hypothetical protein
MKTSGWLLFAVAVLLLVPASAQNVVSMRAGLIHVAEGDVFLNDQAIHPKITEFPTLKDGEVLRTEEGRAEVLLAPGSFLRMGENSSFRLVNGKLADAQIEVLTGEVIVEVAGMYKENSLTVRVKDASASLRKDGIYRFDGDPADIKVYDGEAAVASGGQQWSLKDGKELVAADNGWTTEKFDKDVGDALYRWSKRRSGYMAMANVSTAGASTSSMFTPMGSGMMWGSGLGSGWGSGWVYNPFLGMVTFLPGRDAIVSPFGWSFWSPGTVYMAYWPFYNGYGYRRSISAGSIARSNNQALFNRNLGYSVTSARGYGAAYGTGVSSTGVSPSNSAGSLSSGGARGGTVSAGRGGGGGGGSVGGGSRGH